MLRYSPFPVPFQQIETKHLNILRETNEGWYVEYKEILPNAKSIAKSISAFANHYGGWLFYGIAQSRTRESVADSFPGIPTSDLQQSLDRIRDAVASLVSPTPFFLPKVLIGPETQVGLPKDHAIIVILVPRGANPPYVHGSGRIYRRVSDRSDPKHEADRAVLDEMWKRAQDSRERLKEKLVSMRLPGRT